VEKDLAKDPEWSIEKGAEDVTQPNASSTSTIVWLRGVKDIIVSWYFTWFIDWWAHGILDRLGLCKDDHSEAPTVALVPREDEPPDVKEVWFAGGHADVGGGNVMDDDKRIKPDKDNIKYTPALSNIPLRWMIREFYEAGLTYHLNIRWRSRRLARYGIYLPDVPYTNDDPNDAHAGRDDEKPRQPRPSGEELGQAPKIIKFDGMDEHKRKHLRRAKFFRTKVFPSGVMFDLDFHERDVVAQYYDALWAFDSPGRFMGMALWWFLELIPYVSVVQNKKTNLWESKVRFNFFKHRDIPRENTEPAYLEKAKGKWKDFLIMRSKPQFHVSVLERMERVKGPEYRPRVWHPNEDIKEKWSLAQ